ncbi:MAG: D-sedoheptulose-7-phosphate isomerase [Candidatus Merdivicinus sp.]|jgi:D-sedoheptulose 7-phosphate isomerase
MMKISAPNEILDDLIAHYPVLASCSESIQTAFWLMRDSFRQGGKLLICGNGGSAADCDHITGELMKGFLLKRPLPAEHKAALCQMGEAGQLLAEKLQRALPCIPLTGCPALTTAFSNDVDPLLTFAQQVHGYGRPGDVLLAISTSGNAKNAILAVYTAKAAGLKTIGLTGSAGGKLCQLCDTAIRVPENETFRIQELHLPVYHALCAMLESEFFGEDGIQTEASALPNI